MISFSTVQSLFYHWSRRVKEVAVGSPEMDLMVRAAGHSWLLPGCRARIAGSDLFGLDWSGFELKSTPVQITCSLAHS